MKTLAHDLKAEQLETAICTLDDIISGLRTLTDLEENPKDVEHLNRGIDYLKQAHEKLLTTLKGMDGDEDGCKSPDC